MHQASKTQPEPQPTAVRSGNAVAWFSSLTEQGAEDQEHPKEQHPGGSGARPSQTEREGDKPVDEQVMKWFSGLREGSPGSQQENGLMPEAEMRSAMSAYATLNDKF